MNDPRYTFNIAWDFMEQKQIVSNLRVLTKEVLLCRKS